MTQNTRACAPARFVFLTACGRGVQAPQCAEKFFEKKDERTHVSSVACGWHNANSMKDTCQALRNADGECAHAPDSHCVAVTNSSASFDYGEIPPSQRGAFSPPRPPPLLNVPSVRQLQAKTPVLLQGLCRNGARGAKRRPRGHAPAAKANATAPPLLRRNLRNQGGRLRTHARTPPSPAPRQPGEAAQHIRGTRRRCQQPCAGRHARARRTAACRPRACAAPPQRSM